MSLYLRRTITETREYNSAGDATPASARTETRYAIGGTGRVSVTASCVEIVDPYGEQDRNVVCYWADHDEISCAFVDWLAGMHHTATDSTASDHSRAAAMERLQRFAGAMGLSYGAAMATLPGEVR
jgi:hypothetical protein